METSDDVVAYAEQEARQAEAILASQRKAMDLMNSMLALVLLMPRSQAAIVLEYVTKVNNGRTQ